MSTDLDPSRHNKRVNYMLSLSQRTFARAITEKGIEKGGTCVLCRGSHHNPCEETCAPSDSGGVAGARIRETTSGICVGDEEGRGALADKLARPVRG